MTHHPFLVLVAGQRFAVNRNACPFELPIEKPRTVFTPDGIRIENGESPFAKYRRSKSLAPRGFDGRRLAILRQSPEFERRQYVGGLAIRGARGGPQRQSLGSPNPNTPLVRRRESRHMYM